MRLPVSSSKRRLVSASSGAALEKQTLTELKSTLPARTLGWWRRALNRVGTPLKAVGWVPGDGAQQVVEVARVRKPAPWRWAQGDDFP